MFNCDDGLRVFLVHPGGPYWRRRDRGAWSVPKGEPAPKEDFLTAALREFREETGIGPKGPFLPLTPARQKGGKVIHCWAFRGLARVDAVCNSTFDIEWPPRSGRVATFPEIDRAEYFAIEDALEAILPAHATFLHELTVNLEQT